MTEGLVNETQHAYIGALHTMYDNAAVIFLHKNVSLTMFVILHPVNSATLFTLVLYAASSVILQ